MAGKIAKGLFGGAKAVTTSSPEHEHESSGPSSGAVLACVCMAWIGY